jgi:hypothetical protein
MPTSTSATTGADLWDDGSLGNYYDDYECLDGENGICGQSYAIPGGSNVDRYPLTLSYFDDAQIFEPEESFG